jgi:glycosyltransferase involved in cell wall biosynthesis
MKILYHHRTQGRGAEGVHIVSIVKALQGLGHEVTVLSPAGVNPMEHAGNAPVDKSKVKTSGITRFWQFVSNNIPGLLFEFLEIAYNFPAGRRLEKELRKNNYDLIYERYAFFLIAGALKARKYGIPFVLEANEVNGIKGRARKQYLKSLAIFIEKRLFLLSSRIITVSSYLEKLIHERLSGCEFNGDVIVAPNAIDINKIPKRIKSDELLHELSITSTQKVIGFAGWFDHWDRLDIFVNLIAAMRSKGHDVVGLLIGDGIGVAEARELSQKQKIEDYIIFTGAVNRQKIYSYLSLLDIAVFPHSNEFGSPVVMFEFMALKIPVVAPKLLPILDVLTDRDNALLFDVLDESMLASCMNEIIVDDSLSEKLAENSYNLITEKHTWTNNASLIVDVMKG